MHNMMEIQSFYLLHNSNLFVLNCSSLALGGRIDDKLSSYTLKGESFSGKLQGITVFRCNEVTEHGTSVQKPCSLKTTSHDPRKRRTKKGFDLLSYSNTRGTHHNVFTLTLLGCETMVHTSNRDSRQQTERAEKISVRCSEQLMGLKCWLRKWTLKVSSGHEADFNK